MAYIEVINEDNAEGHLKEVYDNLIEQRGQLAEIHKIQSLNPESIVNHMDLYMTLLYGKSPLKRWQREMIAVVVSASNNCDYCQLHHGQALNHYWKDENRVLKLRGCYNTFVTSKINEIDLSPKDIQFCTYAAVLTKSPNEIDEDKHIAELKKCGATDREILDAAMITAYFNFVNRMVLGLGVHIEKDKGAGYNY